MRFFGIATLVLILGFNLAYSSPAEDSITTGVSFPQVFKEFGIFTIDKITRSSKTGKEKEPDSKSAFLMGSLYMESGDVTKALEEFKGALKKFPDSPLLLYGLAQCYFQQDEFEQCIKTCDRLLALQPDNLNAMLLKAKALSITDSIEDARKVYEKILELKPYHIEALKSLGNIAFTQDNDLKKAQEYYKKVLEVAPKDLTALRVVGTTAALLGNFDEAQEFLFRAIQQNPEFIAPYLQLGKILESANKTETAFKIYRQTLIANPKNKQAQLYFAQAAAKLKGQEGALLSFKELAEEFPDDIDIQLIYAEQLLTSDKLTEAEKVLTRIIELSPGNASALVLLGKIALKKGNPDLADEYFQKATLLYPRDMDLYSRIAKILTENKMLESAAKYLEKALKIQPESTEIFLSLFETYYKQDQLDKAEAITKQIIEQTENKAELYSLLGTLYRVQGKIDEAIAVYNKSISLKPEELETYIKLISLYLQTEQFERAQQIITQAEEAFSKENPVDLYYNLAVVYERWGFFDEAIKYIETLLNIKPEYLPGYSELAHIYNIKRDYKKAVEVFTNARQRLGDKAESVEFYIREAHTYLEQYNYSEAIKPLKKAINKEPSNIVLYKEIITLYTLWEKYSEAMTYIKLAKQKFGEDNTEILTLEAELYSSQHQFEKAKAIIENLLEQNPEDVDLLYSLGGIYYEAQEYDKAVEVFEKILSIDPNNVDALNSLGYTLAIQGKDLDRAEHYIRKALNAKPYAGYIIDSLGWVYFQRGDYIKARELVERANRVSLEDAEILQHLGDIYMKLGDTQKAIKFWTRALEIKPNQKEIEKRLKAVNL